MARRGENIYKRKDGRWEGRYIIGKRDNGKNIYKYVYADKYKIVKQHLIKKKSELSGRVHIGGIYTNQEFFKWADYWLDSIILFKNKSSTYTEYNSKLKCHILPYFGDTILSDITNTAVQDFIIYLQDLEFAPNTIIGIFRVLSSCLVSARKLKQISFSSCDDITLPTAEKSKIVVLSQEEQYALEKTAMKYNKETYIAVVIALNTGLRIGETCALMWDDIDFDTNILNVNRTLQRIINLDADAESKTLVIEDKPKSTTSVRQIPIPEKLSGLLQSLDTKNGYVLTNTGNYLDTRTLQYRFKTVLKQAKLRDVNFHALRHTFATKCVAYGIDPKMLSEFLGHSTVKLTLDWYVHPQIEQKQEAMKKFS